ncbi:MAG TPA: hypothetical protein VFE58_08495 [Tepidisphaeraceae bacterium]|jgi:hypothetical protein|nr:hypothetical protein [Tepidisphaeraceae bacterium]
MHDQYIQQMTKHMGLFKTLKYSPSATAIYDLLSDALIWEDEIPKNLPFTDIGFLRHIWRFRITLLQSNGNPTDQGWTAMRSACPEWPGFRSERCESPATLELFEQLKRKSQQHPLPDQ